jgi:hypothetical protein
MSEPEYVYIVHCATGSGDDIAVSRTSEGAEGIAREGAKEEWERDPHQRLKGPMPADLDEALLALADANIAWIGIDERPLED